MAKAVKVPGEDAEEIIAEAVAENSGLPNAEDIDPSSIKSAVLTNQGWVVPNVQL